jgi:hypothetical protein
MEIRDTSPSSVYVIFWEEGFCKREMLGFLTLGLWSESD